MRSAGALRQYAQEAQQSKEIPMKLTLHAFVTLDGVMQAPGGPDEDRDGDFEHGGWSYHYGDEDFGATVVSWFDTAEAFLLGRRTYDIFSSYWPKVTGPDEPIAAKLNGLPKYVASTTLHALDWNAASLLEGDVVGAVRRLKEQPGQELQVHGSPGLAQTLIANELVDEYRIMTFPVHLGSGKKLFRDGMRSGALRLTGSKASSKGVVFSTYVPDGAVQYGSF
jgi:dihydrofolate reductase